MASPGNNNGNIVRVKRSGIQGRGIFAARRIRKDQQIIEYIGERIDLEEEARRYDDESMSRHHTFLFKIDDEISIDGNSRGNDAKFINHSCDPNCEAIDDDGRIFIHAIKNIQPGIELTYDYCFEVDEPVTKQDIKFYVCHCGTDKCRGTILKIKKPRKRNKSNRA